MNPIHAHTRNHHLNRHTWAQTLAPAMNATPTHTLAAARPIWPLVLLGLAGFISQFDVTALAVALPTIRTSLQLDSAGAAWVVDAYSLAFAAALLPAGYLADRWGRRRILLAGLVVFGAASAACALAASGPALWSARAAQGAGAALLTCATLALIGSIYPQREDRLWAFGWIGTIVGVAMLAGPAGGGALAAWLGWPAIFWINVPLCAALLLGCRLCLDEHKREAAWHSGAGVTRMRDGMRPGFVPVLALAGLLSIGFWATLVYLPLACRRWFAMDPASTGVFMLAATAPMLLLPRFGARLAARFGLGTLFACGLSAVVAGDALLWHASLAPHLSSVLAGMLLAGSGAGLINAQLSAGFVGYAPPAWAGMASALGITMRQLGYAAGVALLAAAENAIGPPLAGSFATAVFAAAVGVAIALRMRVEQGGSRRAALA